MSEFKQYARLQIEAARYLCPVCLKEWPREPGSYVIPIDAIDHLAAHNSELNGTDIAVNQH